MPRGLYLYHMLVALPYVVLATAFVLARIAHGSLQLAAGKTAVSLRGGYVVAIYLVR